MLSNCMVATSCLSTSGAISTQHKIKSSSLHIYADVQVSRMQIAYWLIRFTIVHTSTTSSSPNIAPIYLTVQTIEALSSVWVKFTELPEQMVNCARSLAPTLQAHSNVLPLSQGWQPLL